MRTLTMIVVLTISVCVVSVPSNAQSNHEVREIAKEAYIFAYPMLDNYKTLYQQTQDPGYSGFVGGFNRFKHNTRPSTPADTAVVTPNNDTLYSWAWLDLRREPIVFRTPKLDEGRYNVFQLVDLHTHIFASPGLRLNGPEGGDYLLVGPEYDREIPDGFREVFHSESDFVVCLCRTSIDGPEETPLVRALQNELRLMPLSEYMGLRPPEPSPQVVFPPWDNARAEGADFIGYLNFILDHTARHPDDADEMERFASIGIAPGAGFPPLNLDPKMRAAIEAGVEAGRREITDAAAATRTATGLFGPREYIESAKGRLGMAVGAVLGLYGQNEAEAFYVPYEKDADGNRLDGANTYEVRFEAGRLPPVNIFWSLTMYNLPARLLVANEIDRWSIGDRTPGLAMDDDGGLTLTLTAKNPGEGKNWLPAPEGDFYMVLRMYGPDKSIITGEWQVPMPTKTN